MSKQKIGFIGLGVMGAGMASRLTESGYQVTVYNRTRSKAERGRGAGRRGRRHPGGRGT